MLLVGMAMMTTDFDEWDSEFPSYRERVERWYGSWAYRDCMWRLTG